MDEIREALEDAVELFEVDPECNKVGTDAYQWMIRAKMALGLL